MNASLQLAHEHDGISHTSYYPKEIKHQDINANVISNQVKDVQNNISYQINKVTKIL